MIEGCRMLVRHRVELERIAPDAFAVIVGVESETDDLPVGLQRSQWSSEALEVKDRQRDVYLRSVQEPLLAACRAIRDRVTP